MTDTSIIIEVAKLDDPSKYQLVTINAMGHPVRNPYWWILHPDCQKYLTSRDAIVPVIVKVCKDQAVKVSFLNTLRELIGGKVSDFDLLVCEVKLLSIALLKATGKWKEEKD